MTTHNPTTTIALINRADQLIKGTESGVSTYHMQGVNSKLKVIHNIVNQFHTKGTISVKQFSYLLNLVNELEHLLVGTIQGITKDSTVPLKRKIPKDITKDDIIEFYKNVT